MIEAIFFELLSACWIIVKVGFAVYAAWIAYILYGIHRGFIHFSE